MTTIKTGQQGEQIAVDYLKKQAYQIVERNFKTRFGEIDIIARQNQVLVFIEVKARRTSGQAEWQITPSKIKRVKNMAQVYLITHQPDYTDLRIDAICIDLDLKPQIRHYPAIGQELA